MEGLLSAFLLSLPSLVLQICAEVLFQVSPWLSAQQCSGTGFPPVDAPLPTRGCTRGSAEFLSFDLLNHVLKQAPEIS